MNSPVVAIVNRVGIVEKTSIWKILDASAAKVHVRSVAWRSCKCYKNIYKMSFSQIEQFFIVKNAATKNPCSIGMY